MGSAHLADLAVAIGAHYIRAGGPFRAERTAILNRLLYIEQWLDRFGLQLVKPWALLYYCEVVFPVVRVDPRPDPPSVFVPPATTPLPELLPLRNPL